MPVTFLQLALLAALLIAGIGLLAGGLGQLKTHLRLLLAVPLAFTGCLSACEVVSEGMRPASSTSPEMGAFLVVPPVAALVSIIPIAIVLWNVGALLPSKWASGRRTPAVIAVAGVLLVLLVAWAVWIAFRLGAGGQVIHHMDNPPR